MLEPSKIVPPDLTYAKLPYVSISAMPDTMILNSKFHVDVHCDRGILTDTISLIPSKTIILIFS